MGERVTLRCPACGRQSRVVAMLKKFAWCKCGKATMVRVIDAPHRAKPRTASDRPPVGLEDEPGCLFDARKGEE